MLRTLYPAFLFSGMAALLYQVVWQRMLAMTCGSDIRSVTIVIAAYLAGLGVGSLLGGAVADRISRRDAVRAFAWANLGVAGFAVMSRYLFSAFACQANVERFWLRLKFLRHVVLEVNHQVAGKAACQRNFDAVFLVE